MEGAALQASGARTMDQLSFHQAGLLVCLALAGVAALRAFLRTLRFAFLLVAPALVYLLHQH